MTDFVRGFGSFVASKVEDHPERARRWLSTAYSLVGWKAAHFPDRQDPRARSAMNAATGRCMAACLRHPERAVLVNIFFPCELLHALDLVPMAPEALACYVTNTACEHPFVQCAEDRGVPETYCSYHKVLLGMAESGVLPRPRLILNTSMACDANHLTFRRLAEDYQVPHRTVEVPYDGGGDALEYVAGQLRELVPALEEAAGKRLDPERLKAAVASSGRSLDWYRTYLDRRAARHVSDSLSGELLGMMNNHILLGTPESEAANRLLCQEVSALPEGGGGKRILWVHTMPNWQTSMQAFFNHSLRCEVVGSDMCFDALVPMDPERPYESLAGRLVHSLYRGPAEERIAGNLAWARRLRADGIVVFCHWGCKQTLGMAAQAKREFEAAGFPTLLLDGDGCDSRNVTDGQMATRVGAFLELLEGQR